MVATRTGKTVFFIDQNYDKLFIHLLCKMMRHALQTATYN